MPTDTTLSLAEQAAHLDSIGHHWSGRIAHDFFAAATALRSADAAIAGRERAVVSPASMYTLAEVFTGRIRGGFDGSPLEDLRTARRYLEQAGNTLVRNGM
ncbi:hypothetical protein [Curtobacterium sp. MCSS17_016]|uniref:hypothetical protein n=1 Tax=Curtobacterium sp. MCSS17_016 TaxID=2175644 RepID=UPI000DA89D9B|nr:hypothetical protein [Curtobacterium sp. MCSS17_016]WIE81277.1 hypothetical protein DEJ19_018765 [Curtobacterium sp. MCSS17_016]